MESGEADGYIYTWNVSSSGVLGDTNVSSLEFDTADCIYFAHVEYINQSWYLIIYTGTGNDGWSCTVYIETNWASPVATVPSPVNGSTGQSLAPTCSVLVNDSNADTMTLDWYTSPDNIVWTWQQTNATIANGTYTYVYSGATTGLTTYYWRVTINDSGLHNNSFDYSFTTQSTWTNTCPVGGNFTPANHSIGVCLKPTISVAVNDTDGNSTTVCFYSNVSGTWSLMQVNTSVVANSTVYWNFSQANTGNTSYWWNVTMADENCNVSYWLNFSTVTNATGGTVIIPIYTKESSILVPAMVTLFSVIFLIGIGLVVVRRE
jgi:hypothetical protein